MEEPSILVLLERCGFGSGISRPDEIDSTASIRAEAAVADGSPPGTTK